MTVKKTIHGTWQARWRDDRGNQKAKTFKRKVDADNHLRKVHGDIQRGDYADPTGGGHTITAWADRWLEGARKLKTGGRDTYRRDLDRYILPALGDYKLNRLASDHIEDFLTAELERLAPSTVLRHYRTIHRLCQVAVERNLLAKNPCGPVTPPAYAAAEMRFFTVDQVDALAARISPRYSAWVNVAAYGGPRWSECVGLRRRNVDGKRIVIIDQLLRDAAGGWYRDTPKTAAGRRAVTLPIFVADQLTDHLEEWSLRGEEGLVFPNQLRQPMGPSFGANVFQPALKRAGLDPRFRIHDLRHTAVALAIKAGAHPKAIQARMGHASIRMTLDRYGHLFPEMDGEIAEGLQTLRERAQQRGQDPTGSPAPTTLVAPRR